jgi:hypothetical protein
VTDPRGSECSCSLCGTTFTGIGLFDAHQDVDYTRDPEIICLKPGELAFDARSRPVPAGSQHAVPGLRLAQDAEGTWGTPTGLLGRERSGTRLAAARSARASGNSELEVPQ